MIFKQVCGLFALMIHNFVMFASRFPRVSGLFITPHPFFVLVLNNGQGKISISSRACELRRLQR